MTCCKGKLVKIECANSHQTRWGKEPFAAKLVTLSMYHMRDRNYSLPCLILGSFTPGMFIIFQEWCLCDIGWVVAIGIQK